MVLRPHGGSPSHVLAPKNHQCMKMLPLSCIKMSTYLVHMPKYLVMRNHYVMEDFLDNITLDNGSYNT